nr:putative ribonuclease H-like domain-containing protein [Tanacetum cinerariifolium]
MRPFGCLVTILNTLDSLGVQEQLDAEKAEEESDQQYVIFLVWPSVSTNPQNTDGDVVFDEKKTEFEGRKPESKVNASPSSSAQSKKHDDKTKREAKGKSPVESLTGYRNLSAEFEDFSDNSINEDNIAGTLVLAVGQIFPNSTNTFSVVGPSNVVPSPTHRKSSYVDSSQLLDDLNMPELEDITYFDDEDNVGAEADFNNLETSITVSPIPTTRVHKEHHVTQIIGDLSLATQIRSMIRVAKDQGFEDPDYPDKVYKVVKALYGLHQAPRAWYETLSNYLLKNGFQRGKIDQTLFLKRHKDDILLVQIYVDDIIFDGKSASTPIDTEKPLLKDADVNRIFRYLKGKPHLGLWYPKDSPFDLMAYSDSDYDGASLDMKSTTKGCQFFGCRLISWQCKKQTVMATSSTEAEYVAVASCYAQVVLSGMESLKKILHVLNILSAGSLTTSQMVLNSPCLTHIKNWLVQIKRSLVNDVMRLQALVDKKKVIIMEATIRDALCLDDAEGVECLPSEEIFAELTRMGTSWNEFSSSMASAVIFLSIDVSTAVVAPEGDDSAADDVVPTALEEQSISSPTPPTPPPQPSQDQPSKSQDKIAQALEITKLKQRVKQLERRNKASKLKRLKKVGTTQKIESSDDTIMDDVSKQGRMIADMNADVDVTLKDVADVAKDVVDARLMKV